VAKPFVDDFLTAGAEGGMPARGDVSERAHQSVSHSWMTADGGRTFTSQQHCGHMLGGRTGNRSRKLTGVGFIAGCHGQVSGCGAQRSQHRWVSGVRHCGNHPRMRWITWER